MKYSVARFVIIIWLLLSCEGKRNEEREKSQLVEIEKNRKEVSEMIDQMKRMLKAELVSFEAYYQTVQVTVKFTNLGDEPISSFQGGLQFINQLENTMCEFPIKSYDELLPSKSRNLNYRLSTISEAQGCRDLENSKISNVKFRFAIDIILLDDGTRLDPASIAQKIRY